MPKSGDRNKPTENMNTSEKTGLPLGNKESIRHRMIAKAAYFKWQQRGASHGGHLADWLDAETEIDNRLPR